MQVSSALAAAHAARIVHRDIKPENIMVRKDGIVKVLDFGLAKLAEQEQKSTPDTEAPTEALHRTAPGVVMGTASYMSPEQARGLEVDERTDIWSLGVVLYEMVAGRLPFEGKTTRMWWRTSCIESRRRCCSTVQRCLPRSSALWRRR